VAIPADGNVVRKEAEKKLKYKSLCMELQRMWNLKCTIIPIIIGATGIVSRSLRKNLEAVPGKHSIDSLQETSILGTSHIIIIIIIIIIISSSSSSMISHCLYAGVAQPEFLSKDCNPRVKS